MNIYISSLKANNISTVFQNSDVHCSSTDVGSCSYATYHVEVKLLVFRASEFDRDLSASRILWLCCSERSRRIPFIGGRMDFRNIEGVKSDTDISKPVVWYRSQDVRPYPVTFLMEYLGFYTHTHTHTQRNRHAHTHSETDTHSYVQTETHRYKLTHEFI